MRAASRTDSWLTINHRTIQRFQGHRQSGIIQTRRSSLRPLRVRARRPLATAGGLINATPLGMAKYPGQAVPESRLRPSRWVADIVYLPLKTALLASARIRGCQILNGDGMAVFQAAEAFRQFTRSQPHAERMLEHFLQLTAKS